MTKNFITFCICPICRENNGELIMDRRLKKSLNMRTIVPSGVCQNCKDKYLKTGVLLINPKTCSLIVLKDEAYKKLFNKPLPPQKIAYCDENTLNKINSIPVTS